MVSSSLVSNTCKSGVGLPSSPRIAQQSRKRRLTPDQACLYLVAVDFFIAPDGSLPCAELAETDGKLIPACSPAEVQEMKSPGAVVWRPRRPPTYPRANFSALGISRYPAPPGLCGPRACCRRDGRTAWSRRPGSQRQWRRGTARSCPFYPSACR